MNEELAGLRSHSEDRLNKLTVAGIVFGVGDLAGQLLEFNTTEQHLALIFATCAAAAGVIVAVLSLRSEHHGKANQDVRFNI